MGKRIPPCHLAPQARILSSTIVLVPYYRGDDILVSAWRKFSRDVASSSVRRASANGMAPPSQGHMVEPARNAAPRGILCQRGEPKSLRGEREHDEAAKGVKRR